jgi:hypothetical protein
MTRHGCSAALRLRARLVHHSRRIAVPIVIALPALLSAAAAGDFDGPLWLKGEAISTALEGKTIVGRYANGRTFTESYLVGGRVQYFDDGRRSAAALGGHWSVTAGTLCTIYDDDPAGGCFRIAKVGANCFEFYFAARTEELAPGPEGTEPKWTARGSVQDEPSACQEAADV